MIRAGGVGERESGEGEKGALRDGGMQKRQSGEKGREREADFLLGLCIFLIRKWSGNGNKMHIF